MIRFDFSSVSTVVRNKEHSTRDFNRFFCVVTLKKIVINSLRPSSLTPYATNPVGLCT